MKKFEKKWKESMDDPDAFCDMIPAESKSRIADRIFSKKEKKFLPSWVSHTAAAVTGFILSALLFYKMNDTEMKMVMDDDVASVQEHISEMAEEGPMDMQKGDSLKPMISEGKTGHSGGKVYVQESVLKQLDHPSENTRSDKQHIEEELFVENQYSPGEDILDDIDTQQIIVLKNTHQEMSRKVVPVSDITQVNNKIGLIERLAIQYTSSASGNSISDKSPFKFLNK